MVWLVRWLGRPDYPAPEPDRPLHPGLDRTQETGSGTGVGSSQETGSL